MDKKIEQQMADFRSRNFNIRIVEDRCKDEFSIQTTHNGYQYSCINSLNSIEMRFLYEKLMEHLTKRGHVL